MSTLSPVLVRSPNLFLFLSFSLLYVFFQVRSLRTISHINNVVVHTDVNLNALNNQET